MAASAHPAPVYCILYCIPVFRIWRYISSTRDRRRPAAAVHRYHPNIPTPQSSHHFQYKCALNPCRYRGLSTRAPLTLHKYLEDIKPELKPPVANKMIYNEQLQVMVVGGPNQRKDFHINEGEEVFYQIEGGMDLNILEHGKHKNIHIPEGYMFILPSRIPHSPQRYENTVGMVVERLRHKHEHDGLRYFVPGTTDVLYEEYFHCRDLGSELVPVIQRFFASEASKTNTPAPGMPVKNPPVQIDTDTSILAQPFNWSQFVTELGDSLPGYSNENGSLVTSAVKGREFNFNLALGPYSGNLQPGRKGHATDTYLWQWKGSSKISVDGKEEVSMNTGDITLVNSQSPIDVAQWGKDSCLISITNNAFD